MPSDTTRCATPRTCDSTHSRIGINQFQGKRMFPLFVQEDDAKVFLLTVGISPEDSDVAVPAPPVAALGTIRPRRRSADDDGPCSVASSRAGPMKLAPPRFNAAAAVDDGLPRGRDPAEAEREKIGRHRGGIVRRRAADVARGRGNAGIPTAAVVAMASRCVERNRSGAGVPDFTGWLQPSLPLSPRLSRARASVWSGARFVRCQCGGCGQKSLAGRGWDCENVWPHEPPSLIGGSIASFSPLLAGTATAWS